MNSEIFTQEELERNNKNKKELSELIQSKSALLLVGAGCSISLGYPGWLSLLTELETFAGDGFPKNKTKREEAPLIYADDIKEYIAKCNNGDLDKYYNKLQQIFEPKPQSFNRLHIMLLKLGFKGIVTTNYDIAIEHALTNINGYRVESIQILPDSKRLLSKFFLSLDCNELPKYVLHLHGIYQNPGNIILTYSDYNKAYGFDVVSETDESKPRVIEWRLHSKVLWALLATRRVVFVGFSFEDPYFKTLLDLVAQDLWRWDSTIHFAILPISYKNAEKVKTKAIELRETYGIETVFYIEGDDIHSGLCDIINEIARDCGVKSNTTWVEETNRKMRSF